MLKPDRTKRPWNCFSAFLLLFSISLVGCSGGGDNSNGTPEDKETDTPIKQDPIGPLGTNWHFCADEGKQCSFTGRFEVAYGNNGKFNFVESVDGIACNNETFGDPNPNASKFCWSKEIIIDVNESITINANDTAQSIIMMGGDMERSHRNFDKLANQEEVIQWLIGDIQFDTWRVAYDKHQEDIEGVKNFAVYDNAINAMKMIKAVNPDIKFFATLESDYNGYNQGNRNNLPTFIYDYSYENGAAIGSKSFDAQKYGLFLADYVEYMAQSGVPLTYLATSKEYVGVITADRTKVAMNTMINELDSRGIAIPKIIDAGTWSLSNGIKLINEYTSKDINQHIYGYSSHNYWSGETNTWQDFASAANDVGKFAFNDESGHGGGGPTLGEANFNNLLGAYSAKVKMYEGGMQGEAFFELWPRGFNEIQTNQYFAKPIFFNNGTDGRRMRAYYIMQKFVNAAVNSVYVKSNTNSLSSLESMVFRKDNQLTLWVINQAESDVSNIKISISDLGLKSAMAVQQMYWTETSDIEGVESSILLDTDEQFTTTFKGKSLTMLVIEPKYKLLNSITPNNSPSIIADTITLAEGDSVEFKPEISIAGSWTWQGPNGYSATSQAIQLDNISPTMAGDYLATFTDLNGLSSQLVTTLGVTCNTSPSTTPNFQINDNAWVSNKTAITVEAGDSIKLAPQSETNGDWSWIGPEGFIYNGQQAEIKHVKPKMAGNYVATYTSPLGCSTNITFEVEIGCNTLPTIIPKMQIGGVWSETNRVEFRTGDTFQIAPTSPDVGRWQWHATNNFKAMEVRQLQFQDANQQLEGQYTATLTNPQGCSASETFTVIHTEGECTPARVTPYFRVNTGAWSQTNQANIKVGDTIDIGPQPHGGTWLWTGPNGYTSSERQIQLSNVKQNQAGTYTAHYTPENGGCVGTVDILITIDN